VFWVDFLVEHKDFNSSGKHCNALLVVVVFCFLCCIPSNTPSLVLVPVDYTLRKWQNLAFLVPNYISSILIMTSSLDRKLQKRRFPAQDLWVKIIGHLIRKC